MNWQQRYSLYAPWSRSLLKAGIRPSNSHSRRSNTGMFTLGTIRKMKKLCVNEKPTMKGEPSRSNPWHTCAHLHISSNRRDFEQLNNQNKSRKITMGRWKDQPIFISTNQTVGEKCLSISKATNINRDPSDFTIGANRMTHVSHACVVYVCACVNIAQIHV